MRAFRYANASMRRLVRHDTGESYRAYLKRLASEDGDDPDDDDELKRKDRRRKKRLSNKEWKSSTDEDARISSRSPSG